MTTKTERESLIENNILKEGSDDLRDNQQALVLPLQDAIATTKEEEWVTKKKIELTTTRQIETRVKRQVILEDGKVVEDTGPVVTTNTTEDTEKQEHSQTERRTVGDDDLVESGREVTNSSGRVKEVQEKTVKSREETEERLETEKIQHLGDISDEGYMSAIKAGSEDVRQALEISNLKELVEVKPKIIHQSTKTKKIIDSEDKTESSQIQPGGKIINETKTDRLHEELLDYNISDNDSDDNTKIPKKFYETTNKENSHKFRKTKEQDFTEYIANGQKIGEKIHFQTETSDAERCGDPFYGNDESSITSKLKGIRMRAQNNRLPLENEPNNFKHVNSKKPSRFDEEEETRKEETSKWLEYHFGSESAKSSKGSAEDLENTPLVPSTQNGFISVTMKSRPISRNSESNSFANWPLKQNKMPAPLVPNTEKPNFRGIHHWTSNRRENEVSSLQNLSPSKTYSESPLQSKKKSFSTANLFDPVFSVKVKNGDSHSGCPSFENWSKITERKQFQPISPVKHSVNVSSAMKEKAYGLPENENPTSIQSRSLYSKTSKNGSQSSPFRQGHVAVDHGNENKTQNTVENMRPKSRPEIEISRLTPPKDDEEITFHLPSNKKVYQRTRFAADIPPPPLPKQAPVKQKSKISESFRKLVGKLRSSSADRKGKKRLKNDSRSSSPKENTYQNYNSVDNCDALMNNKEEIIEEPIAPPRTRNNVNASKPIRMQADKFIQRYYLGEDPFSRSIYGQEKEYETDSNSREKNIFHVENGGKNPADGKINVSDYDEGEKENVAHEEGDYHSYLDDYDEYDVNRKKTRYLGKFRRSPINFIPGFDQRSSAYVRRGVQTLPRKLHTDKINSMNEMSGHKENFWKNVERKRFQSPAGSMINVSFVNKHTRDTHRGNGIDSSELLRQGPAKPARTYRSNLSRSQSFNVQSEPKNFLDSYKSNPHLSSLKDSQSPLKSPSMIFKWNQNSGYEKEENFRVPSSNALPDFFRRKRSPGTILEYGNGGVDSDQVDDGKRNFSRSPTRGNKIKSQSNSFRSTSTVTTNESNANTDVGSRLHGNHFSPSHFNTSRSPVFSEVYQDGNTIKTISRSESFRNDDYSEIVRIESKSNNPLHPTETNTVKIFSKKKVPLHKGHAVETIESSETTTVVKSQCDADDSSNGRALYNASPSGVVIKVINSKN